MLVGPNNPIFFPPGGRPDTLGGLAFRAYDDQDEDDISSSVPVRRDLIKRETASSGKKETGKTTKKTAQVDKAKTAEEAREQLLREEASVREKVMCVQRNLSVMLRALGEMDIANPVFTHCQLPSLVKYIEPLLRSQIILLASKKTALHDDVLRIISMHLDPILPLPKPRMLSALYHALGVVPAYQVLIAPMLNELCLGLQSDELASSSHSVYVEETLSAECLELIF